MKQYRFLAVLAVAVCSVVFSAVSAALAAVEVHDFAGLQSISKTTLREMNNDGGRYAVLAQDMLVTSDMTVFCGNNIPRKSGSIMRAGAAVYVWFNNGGGDLVDDGSYDYYTPTARTRTTTTTQRRTTTTTRTSVGTTMQQGNQPTVELPVSSSRPNTEILKKKISTKGTISTEDWIILAAQRKSGLKLNGDTVDFPERQNYLTVELRGDLVDSYVSGKPTPVKMNPGEVKTLKTRGGWFKMRPGVVERVLGITTTTPAQPTSPQPIVPQQSLPVQQSQPQGGMPVIRPRRGGSSTSNGGATMQQPTPQPTSSNNGSNTTARGLLTATETLFPAMRPVVTTVAAMDAAAQGQQTQQRQQGTPVYDANGKLLGVTIGDKFYPAQ